MMVGWHSVAIAVLTVAGIACCGVGVICILASDKVDEVALADRTIGSGICAGFVGLVLIAAAFGVRAL